MTRRISVDGCGLVGWSPSWVQRFASTQCFLVIYGLLGTVQSMAYVYFIATLTTIERRFKIPSRTTGLMLSGNETSQILLSLLLSYYGGQRHRPRWIAWGVTCSALSCFVLALPHFLYGPGSSALSLTKEYHPNTFTHTAFNNQSSDDTEGLCSERSGPDCDSTATQYSIGPPLLVFLSQFILGIGTTLYYSLGQTYIDDNTKKKKTPLFLGWTMSLRTLGPIFGFLLGYACLNLYIDPRLSPLIDKKDHRWLGAWWLGWLIIGSTMLAFAGVIAMFPKNIPSKKPSPENGLKNGVVSYNCERNTTILNTDLPKERNNTSPPKLKDFPAALKRLMKNKLLVINIFSGVFYVLGSAGYITYLTKYLEVQFNKTAASANIITGPTTLLSMVFGFLLSGIVISKFQPKAKYLLSWNVFVGLVYVIGELYLVFVSCQDYNLFGYNAQSGNMMLYNDCNAACDCESVKFSPVCHEDSSITFYSPCHVGCQMVLKEADKKMFGNCSCVPTNDVEISGQPDLNRFRYSVGEEVVSEGPCSTDCGYNFLIFVLLAAVMNSLGSSGKIGNILVNYRAVHPDDKSFAQGLGLLLISLFAFIPGPILYGAIIDSTCVIWDENCGQTGNCWRYDKEAFRLRVNFTSAGITLIGVILDVIVCFLGKDLKLYDEIEDNEDKNTKSANS